MKTAEEILSRKRLLIKDGVEWTPVNSAIQAMEEYAQQIELPSDAEVKHPIGVNCKEDKKRNYCYHCGTTVKNQKYCHGCGYKLKWDKIKQQMK